MIDDLLRLTVEQHASDLHLSTGAIPMVRVDGELQALNAPVLTKDGILDALQHMMSSEQMACFLQQWESDLSYQLPGLARFRVNAFHHRLGPAMVCRVIPDKVTSLEALGAPPILQRICQYQHGLVLITGPTGSGKSTTMAAMVDAINRTMAKHIITIENPVEFVHQNKQSLINQREVGQDTRDFHQALRAVLREDPDIILVGEMRDIDSIRLALTAAETGHLVISTLHTNSAPETIDRIINVFPAGEQNLIRGMLSASLQAVIAQTLLKRVNQGRVAAYEIMVCNAAIRHQIRDNKIAQMVSSMQTGQAEGMCTMAQSVAHLVRQGVVAENK